MKFMLALLAAVGFASALPEPIAGGGDYGKLTTQCYHTSTCKAVYYTKQKSYTKPVYVDATKTEYKVRPPIQLEPLPPLPLIRHVNADF